MSTERTEQLLADTGAEVSRADAKLSSLLEAARHGTVSPSDLNEAQAARDLAAIAHDQAQKDHADAIKAERLEVSDQKMNEAPVRLRTRLAEVERSLAEFRDAAESLWAAVQSEVSQYALIVGDLTSTVEPHSTDRFSNGPAGIRVDGKPIKHHKSEVGVEVMRATHHLISLASSGVGESVRQAGSVMNGLPSIPSSKKKAA